MTTTDIAVRAMTDLTIEPEQAEFTPAQVAALQQLGVEDAPPGDLAVFFHQAKRTGLDPFAKQIYMLGRRTKIKVWNEQSRKQEEKWVMKYTIQTGIDGYRVTGHRLATKRADDIEVEDPLWCGEDGSWADVWLDRKNPPLAAKYTIVKNGKRFTAVAMYDEYVQTYTSDGEQKPNSMWAKMPANQLSKCAEAGAWRKAYPNDFSGLVLEDAAQNIVIDGEVEPAAGGTRPAPKGGNAGLRAAINSRKEAPIPEEPQVDASNPVENHEPEAEINSAQLKKLRVMLDEIGLGAAENRDQALAYMGNIIDRELTSSKDLTSSEAQKVFEQIERDSEPQQPTTEGA